MSIFSVFETFTRFRDFVHEERGFEHREGVIRDQRQKTNQNMYKKVKNKFHSNFALAEPYTSSMWNCIVHLFVCARFSQ
jgi:hypothetical protein